MLDNIAALLLMVGLLGGAFGFPESFALRYMIPGTALGVLVGDLLFTAMAFRLARSSGRNDITAMPLGIDTPSTFGMVFFVLGPAYLAAKTSGLAEQEAATYAWRIGMCAIITSGVFKLACSLGAGWMRQVVPRAGLLGSLAAIAMVLISFLPLLDVARVPVVGFMALALILATLVSRLSLPGRIPGALGAVLVGTTIYYLMQWTGTLGAAPIDQTIQPQLGFVLPWPTLEWWEATVVGGIDCTESAAAVGDEYHTGQVVAVEACATLVAGLCGGVIQTTPYIGHPAYKAMGGRAAYTLATALFIGGAGIFGYFAYLYLLIPKAAILPILVFIGLEISSQSFHATPTRHYPAVVFACVPALAYLVMIYADRLLGVLAASGTTLNDLEPGLASELQTMRMLSAGFIVTSLLWASTLVALIDRRLKLAAAYLLVAAVASLFGVIHSPLPGGSMVLPWALPELPHAAAGQTPFYLASAYGLTALMLFAWGMVLPEAGTGEGDSVAAEPTTPG